jgi:hypothetical protein
MPGHILDLIRDCVREGRFDLTDHAWDEMADDNLLLVDVETAILTGDIIRVDKDDPRGTVYVIHGTTTTRENKIGVAVRFDAVRQMLIITVYSL